MMINMKRNKIWICLTLALIMAFPCVLPAQNAGISYFYDDLGRLVRLVDASGNVATYSYDAVGNLLKITRTTVAPTALTILNFSPQQGGIGTSVTIQGQGFSAIPAQNSVTFNGAQAVVTSATISTLTATVPSDASTGPIAVTVNTQTAVSDKNFIIIPAPAIQSIAPAAVASGSSAINTNITVHGANFTGASFIFQPTANPPSINIGSVVTNPSGTIATLSIVVAPNVIGSFTLVASNSSGSSSQVPSAANTFHVLDPTADEDGDGLTNALEVALGTDPLNPSTAGDGITDGWKVFYGLNPLDPTLGAQDADADGLTNLQEFQLGTNPRLADRVPPAVSRIFPADQATNYPLNGRIIARFTEPLLTGTSTTAVQTAINNAAPGLPIDAKNIAIQTLLAYLQSTCCGNSVVPGVIAVSSQGVTVPGTVEISNDGLTVSFTPAQPLDVSTTYNVQVNGVRDGAGNTMTTAFLSSFTSGQTADTTAPFVQATSPQSGASNVPINAAFTLQFSKPMDAATLTPKLITLTDLQTGLAATGMVQVDPSNTVASFVANPPLLVGRTYMASLTSGGGVATIANLAAVQGGGSATNLQDTNGNALVGPTDFFFTTSFDTDTDVPHLVASSPASGDSNVPTNAVIMLQFNEPLSIIGASTEIQVSAGGEFVPGSIALSDANRRVVFTPAAPLAPNTLHTVTVGPDITDLGGNLIDNPGSFNFQTGDTADNAQPLIISVSPADGATGVATNAAIQLQFSKPVSQLTVTATTIQVAPQNLFQGGGGVGGGDRPSSGASIQASAASAQSGSPGSLAGTLAVSADGLTATFTPSAPLATQTAYVIATTGDILDVEGNSFQSLFSTFTTGGSPQTNGPAVLLISPQNGDTDIPVNALVVVKLNEPIEPASVGPTAISVSAGGTPVTGTINVNLDRTELFFRPDAPLAVSTAYTVSVSGFADLAGNPVTPFTSHFTTSASSTPVTNTPQVLSVNPANGATGVPVNTNVVLTFDEGVDVTTVNSDTVQIQVAGSTGSVAGNYAVNGPVVTFTPQSPLPGNTQIAVLVTNVKDLAWASAPPPPIFTSTFTTGAGTDIIAPRVMAVSPLDGATGVGLNASVVLTFSESVNPSTLSPDTLALFAGGGRLSFEVDISSDNRTVTLNPFGLAPSTVVTVVATSGIRDFSGNPLSNFRSQFTTSAGFDATATAVVAQRPGNGATNVSLNAPVVLFLSKPLDASTVQDVVHVAQNGALAQGTLQVKDNGQTVEFLPAAPWASGALVQVFFGDLNSFGGGGGGLASSLVSVPPPPANLAGYQGSFTTAPDLTTVPPSLIATSPDGSIPVPLNAVIDLQFNEPLNPNTVNANTIILRNANTEQLAAGTLVTDASGTIVRFRPTLPLAANATYSIQTTTGIQGLNGLPQSFGTANFFVSGASVDSVPPVVAQVSPPDGSTQVPVNADIHVRFNEPVDPLTVNAATIQVTGGGQTAVASSISFRFNGNPNTEVVLTPQEPLPDNTPMTITISGVQDLAGNQVVVRTTHFVTGAGPATTQPFVINTNPGSQAFDVPLNTLITLQANVPVDPASVNSNTFIVVDDLLGLIVTGAYSTSSDGKTITLAPAAPLAAGRQYSVTFAIGDGVTGITDLAGNPLTCLGLCNFDFTTSFAADTTSPSVVGVSPSDHMTGVPINFQVLVQFNSPVNELTLGQVVLSSALGPVSTVPLLTNGQTTLILIPVVTLADSTQYTLNVAGVQDLSGNALTSPVTATFTTGNTADLPQPLVTLVSPADGANGAPLNTAVNVKFSKAMDPLTITPATFMVLPFGGNPIPGTITVAPDAKSATFVPGAQLATETTYSVVATNGITDLPGQALSFFGSSFTTSVSAQTAGPVVLNLSPPNGSSGVPVNTQVVIAVSEPVEPLSVDSNSIVVAAGGVRASGTTSVSSDGTVLAFTPSGLLAASTGYSVNVSGFKDTAGNPVTPFSSTFTTGASAVADTTGPQVLSISPLNGAIGVAATSSVALTFNEPVDPITVNTSTFAVSVAGLNANLAGSYVVNGAVATFIPLNSLPGNANIQVTVSGVLDLAGNSNTPFVSSFTTATATDNTSPVVLSITPNDGTTGIGLNASVVLTFSKSLNPATVNNNTLGILAGSSLPLSATVTISADNRTVTLVPGVLPASTVVTTVATNGIQDLSGNSLADFRSQFTTSAGVDKGHASVVSQRPGNGATGVPLNSGIVLFANEALDPVSVGTSLHVIQNGVELDGTVSVIDNGQTIRFRPAAPFAANALIQVFLLSTALDTDGSPVNSYQASFHTTGGTVTPALVATSPANGGSNVPLNAVIQLGFNTPLNASTVTSGNVFLFNQFGQGVSGAVSVDPSGQVVSFAPASPLAPNLFYFLEAFGIQTVNGQTAPFVEIEFTTGATTDNTSPAVAVFSPADGASSVPVNANIHLRFSEPINPLSVNAASIVIADANNVTVPASISFGGANQEVLLVPQAPLPATSTVSVTVIGVQDAAGNASFTQTAHFSTRATPATGTPVVINSNPFNASSTASVNTPITVETSVAVDPVTVNSNSFLVQDESTGQRVAGAYSVGADGTTINFVPNSPLGAGHSFFVQLCSGITDLAGNNLQCFSFAFTTTTTPSTTGPSVVGISPANSATQVPINAQVLVQFDQPVDALTLGQITLASGSGPVNVSSQLLNANQTLILTPVQPLNSTTPYTVTVAGVQDLSGNSLSSTVTSTFTTGTGADLSPPPQVASVNPPDGEAGVPLTPSIQLQFSKSVDKLTVTGATFQLLNGSPVATTLTVSPDGVSATLTPATSLQPSTVYTVQATPGITDIIGQGLAPFSSSFLTVSGTPSFNVVSVNPIDTSVDVPVNARVAVLLSESVNPASLDQNSIVVSAGGTPVPGAISSNSNGTRLVFTPAGPLAVSTTYTVSASGFTDLTGNTVAPFSSSFTTAATSTTDNTAPTVVTVSPADGAQNVAVNTSIVLTFSKPIDATSVSSSTFAVLVNGGPAKLAGSYSVTGSVVTFTPQVPLPGSSFVQVQASGVLDVAGNPSTFFTSSFTTAVVRVSEVRPNEKNGSRDSAGPDIAFLFTW